MVKTLPLDLFWLTFLTLIAFGTGKKILMLLKLQFTSGLETFFSLGLGLALLSYITFALAFTGLLYPALLRGILFILALLTFKDAKSFVSQSGKVFLYLKTLLHRPLDLFLIGLFILAIASNLVFNYSPPTQAREMLYDLTLPKIYLENHRMIDLPYQKEYYYPLQIQMLYLLAMAVKGPLLAKLIHYALGIFSAGLVFSLGKELFGEREGFLAMVIFYLSPLATSLSGAANADLGTLFYGLMTFAAFILAVKKGSLPLLLFAGFFAGVCLGTKVTGITIVMTLLLLSFYELRAHFRESLSGAIQKCVMIGFAALLGFSPWLVRSVKFTNNPIAPFSLPLLGWKGHPSTAHEMSELKKHYEGVGWKETLAGFHNLPFGDFIFGGGPLLFAMFLPGIFAPADPRSRRLLLSFAGLNFILLLLILPYPHRFYENRYTIVSDALFAVFAGAGLKSLSSMSKKSFGALASLCLVFPGLTFSLLFSAKRIPLFLGKQTRESYLREKLPFFDVVLYANENLSAGSRVALVGSSDANSFYWNALTVTPYPDLLKERDIDRLIQWFKNNRITHVLVFKNFYRWDENRQVLHHLQHSEEDLFWDLKTLVASHLVRIYDDKDVTLYRVDFLDESNKA